MTNVRKSVTTKLVSPTRFRQILECYGGSPSSWPEDERPAALNLLKGSAELRALQAEAQALDQLFTQAHALEHAAIDQHAVQALQHRIMNQLPEQEPPPSQRNTEANDTRGDATRSLTHNRFWWSSIAASLFFVSLSLGVILQFNNPDHTPIAGRTPVAQKSADMTNDDVDSNEFAQWAWEDITGESLTGESDNNPSTLLALLELELPAE